MGMMEMGMGDGKPGMEMLGVPSRALENKRARRHAACQGVAAGGKASCREIGTVERKKKNEHTQRTAPGAADLGEDGRLSD